MESFTVSEIGHFLMNLLALEPHLIDEVADAQHPGVSVALLIHPPL